MSEPLRLVLDRLREAGCDPKGSHAQWTSRCPAHGDRHPSLSIGVGDDGRALLRCHAGCTHTAIAKALGLKDSQLFVGREARLAPPKKCWPSADAAVVELEHSKGPTAGRWTYADSDGNPVGLVLRWDRDGGGKDVLPLTTSPGGWSLEAMPSPRPLYNLPALARAEKIYICEGEKVAESIIACGQIATTSAGGCQAARHSDWLPLMGKQVIILPDNDDSGEDYAADVAELALAAGAASVRICRLSELWSEIPDGGDFADLVGQEGPWCGRSDDDIAAALSALAATAVPICQEKLPGLDNDPYPLASLPPKVRKYIDAASRSIDVDPAAVATPMLAALASAIGNSRTVAPKDDWSEPSILWTMDVMRSGDAKSPALDAAVRFVRNKEFAELERYKKESRRHSGGEGGPEAEPPARVLINDATPEGAALLLESNPRGLLLERDELGGFFASFDAYRKGGPGGKDRAFWLAAYGGRSHLVDRRTQPPVAVARASVSITGAIPPGVLARCIRESDKEAGLLARFMIAWPRSRARRFQTQPTPQQLISEMEEVVNRLYALELAPGPDGPIPGVLRLNEQALAVFVPWNDYLNHATHEEASNDLRAAMAKGPGLALRIALVLELTGWAESGAEGPSPTEVSSNTVEAAIQIVDWYLKEARRVYRCLTEDDVTRARWDQARIIATIGGRVTVREWQRRRSLPTSKDAEAELQALVEARCGQWRPRERSDKGGRPTREFVLFGAHSPSDQTTSPASC